MLSSAGRKRPHRPEPRRKRAPRAPSSARASHRFVGEAANFFDVSTLDPDQPRGTVAARRVQVALVVEMGIARGQRIFLDQPYLPGLFFAGGLEQCPVAHYGLAARLTIDRPGWAMVVRLALPGSLIDVAKDAEIKFRVLIEDLPLGHSVVEMRADEMLVLEHVLNERADLPPALDARIFRKDAVTFGGELLESITHQRTS